MTQHGDKNEESVFVGVSVFNILSRDNALWSVSHNIRVQEDGNSCIMTQSKTLMTSFTVVISSSLLMFLPSWFQSSEYDFINSPLLKLYMV